VQDAQGGISIPDYRQLLNRRRDNQIEAVRQAPRGVSVRRPGIGSESESESEASHRSRFRPGPTSHPAAASGWGWETPPTRRWDRVLRVGSG